MAKKKIITWQEALSHWKKWVQSIEQTKELIRTKYGDIDQIRERALRLHYLDDTGALTDDLKLEARKVDPMLWDMIKEIEEIVGDFITKEMGLSWKSLYHVSVLDYWKYSVHPEFMPYYGEEIRFVEESKISIWTESKTTNKRGEDEIIDNVSWYRGKVTSKDIIKKVSSPFWPDYKSIKEREKPGRPSEEGRIEMEAILCSLLKEQGST